MPLPPNNDDEKQLAKKSLNDRTLPTLLPRILSKDLLRACFALEVTASLAARACGIAGLPPLAKLLLRAGTAAAAEEDDDRFRMLSSRMARLWDARPATSPRASTVVEGPPAAAARIDKVRRGRESQKSHKSPQATQATTFCTSGT